jgi:hypothetical protein
MMAQKSVGQNNPKTLRRYNDKFLFGGNRENALKRDGYKCVKCGITNEQHFEKHKRRLTVDHIDGNGRNSKIKNNSLSNLQTLCLTCHGIKDGVRCRKGKLKPEDVLEIRRVWADRKTQRDLARQFNVSLWTVQEIIGRRTWRHLKAS